MAGLLAGATGSAHAQSMSWSAIEKSRTRQAAEQPSARPQPAAPSETHVIQTAPTPVAPSVATPATAELTHLGHALRVVLDEARETASIILDGALLTRVRNVGKVGRIDVVQGSKASLFTVSTNTKAGDCHSYVLVALPADGRGQPEAKTGFGGCSHKMSSFRLKRDAWSHWYLVAWRDDAPKAQVAIFADDRLRVAEVAQRPCLSSTDAAVSGPCFRQAAAEASGDPARGIETGDARTPRHTIVSYVDSDRQTGTLRVDGRSIQATSATQSLYVEHGTDLDGFTLFTANHRPAGDACNHRLLIVVGPDGQSVVSEPFGHCRQRFVTIAQKREGRTLWFALAYNPGEPLLDVASVLDGKVSFTTAMAGACFLAASSATPDCLKTFVPGFETGQSPRTAGAVDVAAVRAADPLDALKARYSEAFRLLGEGEIDRALADFDRLLNEKPNNAAFLAARGFALSFKGRFDNEMTDLDRAIAIDPRLAIAYAWRGYIFGMRGENERALAALDYALSLNPKLVDALAFRGGVYAGKADFAHAMADLDKAIELAPQHAMAHGIRGQALAAQNEHEKAIEDFSEVLKANPKQVAGLLGRAASYEASGQKDLAIADYTAAAAIAPKRDSDRVAIARAAARLKILSDTSGFAGCGRQKGQTCL